MPSEFGVLLTEVWQQIGSVVSTISNSALLLIPVGFTFVGGVIGLSKGLMGTKRGRRR